MPFVEHVRRWVHSRFGVALPVERTAVFGASAGGELALALGLRHPDTALREAGADVVMSERVASHGTALWQGEFALMAAWAFGYGSTSISRT